MVAGGAARLLQKFDEESAGNFAEAVETIRGILSGASGGDYGGGRFDKSGAGFIIVRGLSAVCRFTTSKGKSAPARLHDFRIGGKWKNLCGKKL